VEQLCGVQRAGGVSCFRVVICIRSRVKSWTFSEPDSVSIMRTKKQYAISYLVRNSFCCLFH
jgi:hypothetical protein